MTETATSNPLRDTQFMNTLLDLVIPPSEDGRMPGAGSLDLAAALADAIETDPAFAQLVLAGLRAIHEGALNRNPAGFAALAPADRLEVLEAQLGHHPALMIGLSIRLYQAYYAHPLVLEGIGEPARPPFPEGFEIEPTDEDLLESLRARRRS